MAMVVINGMGKRKKEQDDDDDDNDSLSSHNSNEKPRRVVWSDDLHAKFVEAVNKLESHDVVPSKIAAKMNVDGITRKHVASHLQKCRLGKKKAAPQLADRVPSTMTDLQPSTCSQTSFNINPAYNFPTQSQNMINNSFNIHPSYHPSTHSQTSLNIHPSYNFPIHQSDTNIYPLAGLNMSGLAPSTLVQSQNINIHPPPSTFPTYHQTSTFPTRSHNIINNSFNIQSSYNFPVNQTSTLLLPNKMPLHQSHTLPNTDIYTSSGFNMSGVSPTQSLNNIESSSIIHPTPSTFPMYHQTSTFPTLANQSTSATSFDFHNAGTFVGSASSKSTSIWDYDWYTKFMKMKLESLQFSHNSLPVLESDKTSQMNNSQQTHNVEPTIAGSSASLEDTNINISDYDILEDNSFIDFSVEETDPNTLEDIANMSRGMEEEDPINVWRRFQEDEVTNVMQQPSCYEVPPQS